jgi:hypothetical protein
MILTINCFLGNIITSNNISFGFQTYSSIFLLEEINASIFKSTIDLYDQNNNQIKDKLLLLKGNNNNNEFLILKSIKFYPLNSKLNEYFLMESDGLIKITLKENLLNPIFKIIFESKNLKITQFSDSNNTRTQFLNINIDEVNEEINFHGDINCFNNLIIKQNQNSAINYEKNLIKLKEFLINIKSNFQKLLIN